jgi:hypothetical protein
MSIATSDMAKLDIIPEASSKGKNLRVTWILGALSCAKSFF